MSEISTDINKKIALDTLEEVRKMLEEASESGDEDALEKVGNMLKEKIKGIEKRIDEASDKQNGCAWDFSQEKNLEIFAEDDEILLRGFKEEDKDDYFSTRRQQSAFNVRIYEAEDIKNAEWKDVNSEASFGCSIIRKADQKYIGYILIHDTRKNLWEVGIDLKKEYCNNRYGTRAVNLFLPKISEITGKKQFQAFVDSGNESCQYFLEKNGAALIDIYDYFFHGEAEKMAEFEQEQQDRITPRMIELAEFLDVEPKMLLTHVLDYRFFVDDGEILNRGNY